jgi:hypothetical protein
MTGSVRGALGALAAICATVVAAAVPAIRPGFGPYHERFLAGGVGVTTTLPDASAVLAAGAPWSLTGWLRVDVPNDAPVIVAELGSRGGDDVRALVLDGGRPAVRIGGRTLARAADVLAPGGWHHVAAGGEGGVVRVYVDGEERASAAAQWPRAHARLALAPEDAADPAGARHFGGAVAAFSLGDRAPSPADVRDAARRPPAFAVLPFDAAGAGWPVQAKSWRGLDAPQPAWTLPRSNAAPGPARPLPFEPPAELEPRGEARWVLPRWRLAAAPDVRDAAAGVSTVGYDDRTWWPAIVPGTVLTTLIANGVYPDPDVGLNNLAIPESLSRHDWWYRTEFATPAGTEGRRVWLTFDGINYAAEAWLNGVRVGSLRGAFLRGRFDVGPLLHAGARNALAVRVSPPPHPGIPHEQSVAAGPGENGGRLALDGPTFIATEGWDWIPGIRDRDTGLWQDVRLEAAGPVRIADPQVLTHLPLPRTDVADVELRVPLENDTGRPQAATLEVRFAGATARRELVVAPGRTELRLGAADVPALHVVHPRLWWPNGYGEAALHELGLAVAVDGRPSDAATVRFGIREISYELSLFDASGRLQRVEVDPAAAAGVPLVDVRHEALNRTATGWAASLTDAGERSNAVRPAASTALTPYLAIRVNGVPIAVRGGNWGMDDSRKRIGRERLEPYFRLHRAAHLNTIRNWLGQNTEPVFYDLADEYGLLVLNDFWVSTQEFQLEPEDPALFLANARDVIRRYRNHPSIAVWFGRNEGVPPPILNEGLAALVSAEDGTRHYTGSSNVVNLQGSGPYDWHRPEEYYTSLARGFSVEVGLPSLASREALEAMIPPGDRWPIGDTYAYHDWHFGGNGDTASFTRALAESLGPAADFADFERKAQLLNYDGYRAVFEGFAAGLWTRNSGRLLWMTHPAWPSNAWQIYSADYDTPAAYYAVAKACEPLHAQLDLPTQRPQVVNTTRDDERGLSLASRVLTLDNRVLASRTDRLDAPANAVSSLDALPLTALVAANRVVLVEFTLRDRRGAVRSRNVYWRAREPADLRALDGLRAQPLTLVAAGRTDAQGAAVDVRLTNPGPVPALLAKLTVQDAAGQRVLPAYYDDNYVTLLPGQTARVTIRCPVAGRCTQVALRGWNVPEAVVPVAAETSAAPVRSAP